MSADKTVGGRTRREWLAAYNGASIEGRSGLFRQLLDSAAESEECRVALRAQVTSGLQAGLERAAKRVEAMGSEGEHADPAQCRADECGLCHTDSGLRLIAAAIRAEASKLEGATE